MAAAGLGAATRMALLDAYADESKVVVSWQLDLEDWHVRLDARQPSACWSWSCAATMRKTTIACSASPAAGGSVR